MQKQGLDYKKTFLIGFGFFGISVMWTLYNSFVPIFLQAGNPLFDPKNAAGTNGFGLDPGPTGIVMTLDNVAAFFILPLIGLWSDRIWTRFGRRMPFILVLVPIAVVAFMAIPLAASLVPAELNGQTAQLGVPLALFMVVVGIFLLAMAGFRTPVIALMPDLTPSPLRSKANGVINLMGGVGTLAATLGAAALYRLGHGVPFLAGGALMILAAVVLFVFIKEPRELAEAAQEEKGLGVFRGVQRVPDESRRSLFLLMGAIFCWSVGYNAVETFLSSYGVNVLGMSPGQAALLLGAASLSFLIFAIPSGFIAGWLGRRRTIIIGLAIFGALLVANFFLKSKMLVWGVLGIGGMAWALVNINSLPMVVDIAASAADLGTYTGLYYLASQAAAVVGPIVNGYIVQWGGNNYNLIFVVTPAFFLLAILCMLGVTRGEAQPETKLSASDALSAVGD